MLTMSGRKSCRDCVAAGRWTLMFSVRLICKLTIMNDASRKNMMSISGMMTIRDFRGRTGEGSFIGKMSVAGGLAGWRCPGQMSGVTRFHAAANHHFDIGCRRFQLELQLRYLRRKKVERNQREDGDAQAAGRGD